MKQQIRMGAGAGFSGDRIEPALELVEKADLDYLAFECLAERTIGLAQAARLQNAGGGYDPSLERRMRAVLPMARAKGVRIITNMGAANVAAAAEAVISVGRELGLYGLRVGAVHGDDVSEIVRLGDFPLIDRDGSSRDIRDAMVSANAYLGVEGIVTALQQDADIVVTGRVCDPALFLAPLVYEFGWQMDDWERLGRGTLVGHLLECAGQLTGGYFADPGHKDVRELARLGFPYASVSADGAATFTKVDGSGGRLDAATCKEQMLYEVLDPGAYLQADVAADFRHVVVTEAGRDQVSVIGARGDPPTGSLKVSICYEDGWAGQGQIAYAGPGAKARAELAFDIVKERLSMVGANISDLNLDLIGWSALDRTGTQRRSEPFEVVARISGRAANRRCAEHIGAEVEALYTNGPAGGGGVSTSVKKVLAVASTLVPRAMIHTSVDILVA